MDAKEKELVLKAVRGDQMAYRMLYQIHEKAVRGRVNGYFHWKADADDVVLESFQKAKPSPRWAVLTRSGNSAPGC